MKKALTTLFQMMNKSSKNADKDDLLKLPPISETDLTAEHIGDLLDKGYPIWTWANVARKCNAYALENIRTTIDVLTMFRKELDLIVRYDALFTKNKDILLKISQIRNCSSEEIKSLIETDICHAYKVYFDPEKLTENLNHCAHDLDYEYIKSELQNHHIFYVTEDHFLKNK